MLLCLYCLQILRTDRLSVLSDFILSHCSLVPSVLYAFYEPVVFWTDDIVVIPGELLVQAFEVVRNEEIASFDLPALIL